MRALKWGLSLSLAGDLAQPALIADVATAAETAGWDGFFVWDHLWNRSGEPFADPWVTLAAVATATRRVRIGPLVTPLPRRRAQVVAQQAATLDRLSNGRLTLGVGLGHDNYGEYSAFNEPLRDARSRATALDSALEMLTTALTGDPVASTGGRPTTISCVQRPRCPIWVAATVPTSAGPRRAARLGLEGIAAVGGGVWTAKHVSAILTAGGFEPGDIDVVLVGGTHPGAESLAEAGATWAVSEIMPGTSAADALAVTSRR
jgi:alkanesulfonate monooxygenase SsuD/methylene tetrahydromethanopterin reductase-like flavin-dependent oxidoreductase (luciferase family)